jgi:hypothetical protein
VTRRTRRKIKRKPRKPPATNLLDVPSPETYDKLANLADWVEVKALLESDGNASQLDLARALGRAYPVSEETAKILAADVFKELVDRHQNCNPIPGKGLAWEYPFTLNSSNSLLSVRTDVKSKTKSGLLYKFLLVASRAEMDAQRKLSGLDPAVLFEQLCADILLNFWGGATERSGSLVFGTAGTSDAEGKRFQSNIQQVCSVLKEGLGFNKDGRSPGSGDGKLDIVVWRTFSDGRAGALVGFGQCKTGIHWRTHLTKLQPRSFCQKFFQKDLIIEPIRVYMVPHRVDGAEWNDRTADGGLLLDRCRLVQYGYDISKDVFGNCEVWLDAAIRRQRQGNFIV